jgi:hypothetical protein
MASDKPIGRTRKNGVPKKRKPTSLSLASAWQAELSKAIQSCEVVMPLAEEPIFRRGERIRVQSRPIGHYRAPTYLRGKSGRVEAVIELIPLDEEPGYDRYAGSERHYYRIAVPMSEIWADYPGSPRDSLHIEVFESWLERIEA